MIALKIITIVLLSIIAFAGGFAIKACIDLNKKYNKIVDLLTKASTVCVKATASCGEILEYSKQIKNDNKSLIKHLDSDISFIRQNMIRRKRPIID